MMDVSITKPKLAVVTIESRREKTPKEKGVVELESAESVSDVENACSPNGYISPMG